MVGQPVVFTASGTTARDSDLKVLVHEVIVVQRVKSEDCAWPAKSSRVAQHAPMFPGSCYRYAIIAKARHLERMMFEACSWAM